MTTTARYEIPHEELDSPTEASRSARYNKIGFVANINGESFVLLDKIVYQVNTCPHCYSRATWHRRVQEGGDLVDNVWRTERKYSERMDGLATKKFDFCLDCQIEFLIEIFIYKRKQP